jgi:hypothetical protein
MEFCQCKGKIFFTKARLIHCLLEIRESLIIIIFCSTDRMCDVSIDDDEESIINLGMQHAPDLISQKVVDSLVLGWYLEEFKERGRQQRTVRSV